MSIATNALNIQVLLFGLFGVFAVVYCKNPRQLDCKTDSERVTELYMKELRANNSHSLGHELYAQDFVRISPGSVIIGDFGALENFFKGHFKKDHYTYGPAHAVSTCGNSSLVWRKYSFRYDKGVVKKGIYVSLYVSEDGESKIKLFHSTV